MARSRRRRVQLTTTLAAAAAGAALCLPAPLRAARPFVTDDARLTTAGACQLEAWVRSYRANHEVWALPSCNPGGNLELTVGGGTARDSGHRATADYVLQAKTLFRSLRAGDWGWGLALGTVRHPENRPGPNQLGNVYAYLPLSASFDQDAVVVHANLGWLRDTASRVNRATWGLGAEVRLGERLAAMAESFGDNRPRPYWQAGLRYVVVPDLVQVDATAGGRFAGARDERWLSLGVRITPARLF